MSSKFDFVSPRAGRATLLTVASAAIIAFAAPVAAQATQTAMVGTRGAEAGGSGAQTSQPRAQTDQRRICVRAQLTGSRVERLICRTRTEWQAAGGVPGEDD
jgi:hypothetical protein